ncbi:MAG: UPF0182 family protein [Chitinivibrionales bacterium]
MFFLFGLILVIAGAIPLIITLSRRQKMAHDRFQKRVVFSVWFLVWVVLALIGSNIFFHFYTEYLWFSNLDYTRRFWTVLTAESTLYAIGAAVTFLFFFIVIKVALGKSSGFSSWRPAAITAALLAAFTGLGAGALWEKALLYIYQVQSPVSEPVFNRPVSYYLFSLPFYSELIPLVVTLLVVGTGTAAVTSMVSTAGIRSGNFDSGQASKRMWKVAGLLMFLVGALLLVLAFNSYLDLFRLLFNRSGPVVGADYVDVNYRTIGLYLTIGAYLLGAILLVGGGVSKTFRRKVLGFQIQQRPGGKSIRKRTLVIPAVLVGLVILFRWAIPQLVASLYVEPNEISLQLPYVKRNITYTRYAFSIDSARIDQVQYNVGGDVTPQVADENPQALQNVRLWDWRALMDNLREKQEIRLYYVFNDVDIDRYNLQDYHQTMLSVRELDKSALSPQSQNWVSRHLKYTHGFGLVMLPVHDFLPQGGPDFLIKSIPPEVETPHLQVAQPRIYYGELTDDVVYVNTTEPEFDFPAGDTNQYNTYDGHGGVGIGSLFRRFAFALKNADYRLLLSTYFTEDSRILFDRQIKTRIQKLAPFLHLDRDPYAVLTERGRIVFIADAYTTSEAYPYAEKYRGRLADYLGVNYIRNSVKVVVDAYHGDVDFYVADTSDVIIKTYERIFPGLLKPISRMPDDLHQHIRYPVDYFTIQAEMYATYHMADPNVFYQREDVWEFATERYRENFQSVTPYYVMVHFPEEENIEMVLMLPFTPKNKNVMNAWMAARCDPPHYGKLRVFPFPKGVEVLGPRQIEARIDQDTQMSQLMTLWGQRGSSVIRGNLLAIPLFSENTLYIMYAEPIFIQAENAQLPEIKRIVLADQQRVVWADNFENALERLTGRKEAQAEEAPPQATGQAQPSLPLIRRAVDQFEQYQSALRAGNYEEAGRALDRLKQTMRQLEKS